MLFVLFENPRVVFLNHLRYLDGFFRVTYLCCFVYNKTDALPDNVFVVQYYDEQIRKLTDHFIFYASTYDFDQAIYLYMIFINPKVQYKY